MVTLQHKSLGATLEGVAVAGGEVWQFRGLQYASISARFAKPTPPPPLSVSSVVVDCTSYGPRCPQNYIDFRHLLRIPETLKVPKVLEKEFDCLNLDITLPKLSEGRPREQLYPVLVWIHGGSQTVTFGSSASGLCDPTNLTRQAAHRGRPIIVVTLNYRLNIFAFGDGSTEKILPCQTNGQQLSLCDSTSPILVGTRLTEELQNNITLAGESAGAVYTHAHLIMGAPIRQAILQSGSLYLSPPQSGIAAKAITDKIRDKLSAKGQWTLSNAPASELLKAQAELGIVSLFLQMQPALADWQNNLGIAERLLIGDCEFESVFFRNGIEALSPESISAAFDLLADRDTPLKDMYGIIPDRPSSCKTGALDFLHDVRFTFAIEHLVKQWRCRGKQVFRYLVDQPNPWQPSNRAHHGVDLPLLFGGFDLSFCPNAQRVSLEMSHKWIDFVNGLDPWPRDVYFAFGPLGQSLAINEGDFAARRRKKHCDAIDKCGVEQVDMAWKALAAGRISLNN